MSLASPPSRSNMREGAFFDPDLDFPALGSALWRDRFKILRPTIIVALITFFVVILIPAKYQSEARVLVIGRDNIYLRPDADKDILDRGVVDQEAVTSQAQLILSRDLAKEVIAKLKLNQLPEFDSTLSGVSITKVLLGFFGIIKNPMSMTPEERVLDAYYDRLSVYPVEKSRVIVIDFLSQNPELAAQVANTIAEAYLQRQQAAKQEQARSAGQWLAGEIEQMRQKVADAEGKVEAFRAKSNLLLGPNNTTLSAQQLGELNGQLATARAQKADAEAKAKLIRGMLKSGEVVESSDILNSELLRRLSEQRVTLRAQLAEQSSSLLENHPRIKELRAQIDDLDQQIRKEAEAIARSLENDAKLADGKVVALTGTLDQLKSQAVTSNEDDVQLRALERDAKSQRDLLESYLAKYREASARDTLASAPPDAQVISRATVSTVPAYPKKLPTVLIASLATMMLCSGMVLTRELLASPHGGAVPVPIQRPRLFRRAATRAVAEPAAEPVAERRTKPHPVASEPRAARAAAIPKELAPVGVPVGALEQFADDMRNHDIGGSQIAFFGATPELDVSGLALKFARALSREARAVLVSLGANDAAIREISSDPSAAGLIELAEGSASIGDIITKDQASGLNLIAAGTTSRSALVTAAGMAKTFEALALSYAYVVVDAGPLSGPDIAAVAGLASHAILVVETLSNLATVKARGDLIDAGFDDVTIMVAGKTEAASSGTEAQRLAAVAAA